MPQRPQKLQFIGKGRDIARKRCEAGVDLRDQARILRQQEHRSGVGGRVVVHLGGLRVSEYKPRMGRTPVLVGQCQDKIHLQRSLHRRTSRLAGESPAELDEWYVPLQGPKVSRLRTRLRICRQRL
ncbi:hypothetical protein XFF6994_2620011 [Xanthomonas citri pv. fuscans]|nr:hypothetical protein XFF6994_2620011 [Xanthomonas citri pv. fuscans]